MGFGDFSLNSLNLDINGYLDVKFDIILTDEINGEKSNNYVNTDESVDVNSELIVNDEIRIKHYFVNLSDSVSAADVARIVEQSIPKSWF